MTPITERLAEAYQKLDAINEIIFAAENAAMACDVVQPTIKMLSDSDIKRIFDLSLHAEYEASRTHPAEGGEGRDYVLVPREPTEAMVSAGFDVHPCRTGETKVTDAYKAMLAAAPPPQPVAPERGEAKAVALSDDEIAQKVIDLVGPLCDRGTFEAPDWAIQVVHATIYRNDPAAKLAATPQPPPAPRFRDPTIEDAMRFYDVHTSGDVPENMVEIYERVLTALKAGGFVVNAIGAKVEEKP